MSTVKCTQEQKAEELSGQVACTRPQPLLQCFLPWLAQPSSLQGEPRQTRRAETSLEVPKVSSGMSSAEQQLRNQSKNTKQPQERAVT